MKSWWKVDMWKSRIITVHSWNPLRVIFIKQSDVAVILWKSPSITLSKRNNSLPLDAIRFNCLNWSPQNNFDTRAMQPRNKWKTFSQKDRQNTTRRRREKIIKMQNTFHLDCTCSWLVFERFFFGIDRLPFKKKKKEGKGER